jgi:hypothetical protein
VVAEQDIRTVVVEEDPQVHLERQQTEVLRSVLETKQVRMEVPSLIQVATKFQQVELAVDASSFTPMLSKFTVPLMLLARMVNKAIDTKMDQVTVVLEQVQDQAVASSCEPTNSLWVLQAEVRFSLKVEMVATVQTAIVCQETLVLDSSMVDKAVAVEPVEPLTFVPTALQI